MNDIPDRIHQNLIRAIVKGLSDMPMVLKGGTALLLVYSLDRHSVDIDYDSPVKPDVLGRLDEIMLDTRMDFKIIDRKRTDTTSRMLIHYETGRVRNGLLKIEIKNNRSINPIHVQSNPGFHVYTIDKLCEQKLSAITTRTKARDLYDLAHIARNFKPEISDNNIAKLQSLAKDISLRERFFEDWYYEKTTKNKSIDTMLKALQTVLGPGHPHDDTDKPGHVKEPGD